MLDVLAYSLFWWLVSVAVFFLLVECLAAATGQRRAAPASYRGHRVVITGASSGIGRELALAYAAKGCRLVLAARRQALLDEVKAECLRRGSGEVLALPTDVTVAEQCRALIEQATQRWDGIDLLVLNAGRSCIGQFGGLPLDAVRNVIELNCYGCFYPTWYALPALRRSRGRIVVVSSLAGIAWSPLRTIYCASKHALAGFYNALRLEEPLVTISLAYPGYVHSEIHDKAITENGAPLARDTAKFMAADVCAAVIVRGVEAGMRDIYLEPVKSRLLRWLANCLPALLDVIVKKHTHSTIQLKNK